MAGTGGSVQEQCTQMDPETKYTVDWYTRMHTISVFQIVSYQWSKTDCLMPDSQFLPLLLLFLHLYHTTDMDSYSKV